jgi:hypothetical protein
VLLLTVVGVLLLTLVALDVLLALLAVAAVVFDVVVCSNCSSVDCCSAFVMCASHVSISLVQQDFSFSDKHPRLKNTCIQLQQQQQEQQQKTYMKL